MQVEAKQTVRVSPDTGREVYGIEITDKENEGAWIWTDTPAEVNR